jgi:hypothetical protein
MWGHHFILRKPTTDEQAASAFLEFRVRWLVTHIIGLDRRIAREAQAPGTLGIWTRTLS